MRIFKSPASTVVSLTVTASPPRFLIPSEPNAVFSAATVPVNVANEAWVVISPLVLVSNVFRSVADIEP